MSVVGCIYRVSNENLEIFKSSPNGNPKFGSKILYLDSFFWDINYVLTKYSNLESAEASKIVLGCKVLQQDDTHYSNSTSEDNIQINKLLNEITVDQFAEYLDDALADKKSSISSYKGETIYVEGLISYFGQLKDFYKQTVDEELPTIYIRG